MADDEKDVASMDDVFDLLQRNHRDTQELTITVDSLKTVVVAFTVITLAIYAWGNR